jgi:hypothetical protein
VKLYPFRDAIEMAHKLCKRSDPNVEVWQQFMCVGCGAKNTSPTPFVFYTEGRCEQCDRPTNIEQDGCNFAITWSRPQVRQSQKSTTPSPSPTDQSP